MKNDFCKNSFCKFRCSACKPCCAQRLRCPARSYGSQTVVAALRESHAAPNGRAILREATVARRLLRPRAQAMLRPTAALPGSESACCGFFCRGSVSYVASRNDAFAECAGFSESVHKKNPCVAIAARRPCAFAGFCFLRLFLPARRLIRSGKGCRTAGDCPAR